MDLGKDHTGTELFELLGLKYIDDGPDEEVINHLYGQDTSMTEGLSYRYFGGHDAHFRVDELEARGSEVLFKDEEGIDRVFMVDGEFRAISTSILLCALLNGDSLNLKALLLSEIIDFLAGEAAPTATRENLQDIMRLGNNYPNPFHTQTSIDYSLGAPGKVRIDIFSASGRLVRCLVDEERLPGTYTTVWDGRDVHGRQLNSGFYICRMSLGGQTRSEKLILMK